VDDRPVADRDVVPDDGRSADVDVNHRDVLDVGADADPYERQIATEDAAEPDAGAGPHLHVADDHGPPPQ